MCEEITHGFLALINIFWILLLPLYWEPSWILADHLIWTSSIFLLHNVDLRSFLIKCNLPEIQYNLVSCPYYINKYINHKYFWNSFSSSKSITFARTPKIFISYFISYLTIYGLTYFSCTIDIDDVGSSNGIFYGI